MHRAPPIPRFLSGLALLLSLALPLQAHEVPAEVRLDFWVLDTPEAVELALECPWRPCGILPFLFGARAISIWPEPTSPFARASSYGSLMPDPAPKR